MRTGASALLTGASESPCVCHKAALALELKPLGPRDRTFNKMNESHSFLRMSPGSQKVTGIPASSSHPPPPLSTPHPVPAPWPIS